MQLGFGLDWLNNITFVYTTYIFLLMAMVDMDRLKTEN